MRKWIIGLLPFLLTACDSGYQEEQLHGSWTAVAITEEGTPLAVDPSVIQLSFFDNQQYTYQSTLNYREAGTYSVASDYLYTRDTLNQASTEKAVELLMLSQDSLKIKMMEAGKERRMVLVKD